MAYVIGGLVILALITVIVCMQRKMDRTFARLNHMVDEALSGKFDEGRYDESQLSQLESKWKQFIETSVLSKQSLETERRNLQSLLSDVSHQTRVPLSNILLYTQLLKETIEFSKTQMEFVDHIEQQSDKLNFLINTLVKTSRLEAGIITLDPQNQRVFPMLLKSVAQVQNLAEQKRIQLGIVEHKDNENRKAKFDLKWTEEAIYNILDNAVKYTDVNGRIEIEVIPYELFTCIAIRDTGIGIKEEEINNIFKRFYRSKEVQLQEGVGIGLYLAREIIRGQGGYIKVHSEKSKGSVFSLFIPS